MRRILHCSDIHGHALWYDWLVHTAVDYDLVCLTGDLLDLLDLGRIDSQLLRVQAALARVAVPLAICSGNNDSYFGPPAPANLQRAAWLAELRRPGVWIDGDEFYLGGLKVRCVGWNALLPAADPDEIWLFHAPPAKSLAAIGRFGGDVGDEILGEICHAGTGPRIILSGHQHDPIREVCLVGRTWCCNPGYGTHESVPNYIEIDMLLRTAVSKIPGRADSVTLIK